MDEWSGSVSAQSVDATCTECCPTRTLWDGEAHQLMLWHDDGPRVSGRHGWSEARAKGVTRLAPATVEGMNGEQELVALFDRLNAHHFGGTLPSVPIRLGLYGDADPDVLAQCRAWDPMDDDTEAVITIHVSESLLTGPEPNEESRWRQVSRCLLHEMVHVAVELDWLGGRYADEIEGHGREFANECNRISRAMGWDQVVAAEKTANDSEDAMWWPLGDGCWTCCISPAK